MPQGTADPLDLGFHALSDPTRRAIWLELAREPGLTTAQLALRLPRISRWAVMKHLVVLRESGLIQTLPEGPRRRHYRDQRALAALLRWLDDNHSEMAPGTALSAAPGPRLRP
jgi:DNA-binding transcriptional ArsR family regulator